MFVPKPAFDDLNALHDWLRLRCNELAERAELRPLGRAFDGYVERTVRVCSTCLVQYVSNRYSVPSRFAGQHVSLRAYAGRNVLVSGQDVIAEHKRRFTRNVSYFEPWHYVPLLDRKPGALRDCAPFVGWQLPESMHRIREHYMAGKGGDREFVDLVLLTQDHGIEVVETACDLAVEQNTLRLRPTGSPRVNSAEKRNRRASKAPRRTRHEPRRVC
ncbi:Mu transposase domain-containing protein, partial [Tritonibacter mobilis]|uniref:Mu transposase domain-containing protein n=1 Tax=Tritonibacter mobilis TaxID=379347 RepID=UPI003873A7E1